MSQQNTKPKAEKQTTTLSRIALALLDRYEVEHETRGCDPYNSTRREPGTQWRGNAHRI